MKQDKSIKQKDLISIIVPVYNAKFYIEKCVKSIRNQTYSKIEIILVDDGSTDGSSDICDQIKRTDERIKVIHCKNGGAALARNRGLDLAEGEYIMFVDSDDYIDLKLCQVLMDNLKKYNSKCCICGYQIIRNKKSEVCVNSNKIVVFSGREAIKKRYLEGKDYVNIINPWGKLYYWDMWKQIRFTPGLYYEDLDVMPYLYSDCEKVVCIPDIGYYYVQRIGSCSNGIDSDDKRYIDSLEIRKKHTTFFKQNHEMELAYSIMKKTIELIITSDCKNWIPNSYKKESRQLIQTYIKELITKRKFTIKDRIRWLIYRCLGKKIYKICATVFHV